MQIPRGTIKELTMYPAVMNGGGAVKRLEEVREMARSPAGGIVVGSVTLESRPGNTGNVFWTGPIGALNSIGLLNSGKSYYDEYLPVMAEIVHGAGKVLVVNVAGFKPAEFAVLAAMAARGKTDVVELNLGCPNVFGEDGQQKGILSFYPDVIAETLELVKREVGGSIQVWVKVSPFSNPEQIKTTARVFIGSGIVSAVTAINTFPNAYGVHPNGRPYIDSPQSNGLAGFSGAGLKLIALGQVFQWREALPPEIEIVGVGGIRSASDMADFFRGGKVAAVQLTTALLEQKGRLDPGVFERLLLEYDAL